MVDIPFHAKKKGVYAGILRGGSGDLFFWIGVSSKILGENGGISTHRIRVLVGIVNFVRFWRRCLDGLAISRAQVLTSYTTEGFPSSKVQGGPLPVLHGVEPIITPQKMTLFFMDFSWGEISPYFLEIISPHLFHWFYKGPPVDMVGLVHPPNSRFRQRWYLRIFSSPKTVPWKFHGNFSSRMISGCQRNQQKRFRNTLRIIGSQN